MDLKEAILQNLAFRIEELKKELQLMETAYRSTKELPEVIFSYFPKGTENKFNSDAVVSGVSEKSDIERQQVNKEPVYKPIRANNPEFGRNRKSVIEIITTAQKPLSKADIVSRFSEIVGKGDPLRSVTYALNDLHLAHKVKPFKPPGKKIRGYLWTMPEWWQGEKLKKEYSHPMINLIGY